eukprot:CAMPEP_0202860012 /NCGR_PEP_ID=MMETSP1391-20130828/1896_1 /ASSEMBLY_ACC=CAM_ASM_000867 /TAXON_ID=1034604 /ORGANISM="Chlamydomonas leiostraca, Strain SAG 11-49" /LENGTH=525 /DNA_ID=CAMNT_0049539131 /DNA_START=249 /DNA_END=1826 /DNA_ORIENTATION=+
MTRGHVGAWLHGYLSGRWGGSHAKKASWTAAAGGNGPGKEGGDDTSNNRPKWKQLLDFYTASGGMWEEGRPSSSQPKADSATASDASSSVDSDTPSSSGGGKMSSDGSGSKGLGRSSSRLSQLLDLVGSPEVSEEARTKKRDAVRSALEAGTLGLGFSAGGFLYCYHLGVLWELRRLGILPPPGHPQALKMAGASAGSLAIATYACGLDVDKATQALFAFAADCRSNGTRGRLGGLLRDFLHAYLPPDAHERCRDLTYVAVTRVFPVWQPEAVHRFRDKDDLVSALITSCHIPFYANGEWMTRFRGRYYMDGGVASFIPSPPTPTTVKVCCFPVSDILNRVQPSVQSSQYVSSLLDVSISPDAYEPWAHSYQQLLNWALVPAEDEVLTYLIDKGRRDAAAWARHMELIPADAGAGADSDAAAQAAAAAASGGARGVILNAAGGGGEREDRVDDTATGGADQAERRHSRAHGDDGEQREDRPLAEAHVAGSGAAERRLEEAGGAGGQGGVQPPGDKAPTTMPGKGA